MDPQLLASLGGLLIALFGASQWQIRRLQRSCDQQASAHALCTWKLNALVEALQHAGMTVPDEMWATEIPKRRATDVDPPAPAVPIIVATEPAPEVKP